MIKKIVFVAIPILITSIAFEIILNQTLSYVPSWIVYTKFILLFSMYFLSILISKLHEYSRFLLVLTFIILINQLTVTIQNSQFWHTAFDSTTFTGNFGSSILLKIIGVVPMIALLFIMFKSNKEFFFCKGDLNTKADKISWLGIKSDTISWRKLTIFSAVLISLGTILLTIFTVTSYSSVKGISGFIKYLPFISLLALGNSFCEGVLFRSAILGTLKNVLPKNQLIIIAALFFGIGHYYGAPGGPIGIVMGGLLGWYLCRSMYETKGFASSWIIHFAQDFVIFSTIYLLGNFS